MFGGQPWLSDLTMAPVPEFEFKSWLMLEGAHSRPCYKISALELGFKSG